MFRTKKAEIYQNNVIDCEHWDLNSPKKVNYYNENWHIFKGFKGIWYDIFPVDRKKDEHRYDKERINCMRSLFDIKNDNLREACFMGIL